MTEEFKIRDISITTVFSEEGRYACRLSSDTNSHPNDIECTGETEEHAIAIALEQLASRYRQAAEAKQNIDWDSVERSEDGKEIEKRYHVILHYERLAEDISKFEAMHNTIMGNTVVENAQISIIEVGANVQVEPLSREWDH